MNKKQREQMEAVDTLKQWGVVDGTTVYAKVNNVSASGMSRNITLYVMDKEDGRILDISYHAARALEWPYREGYNGGVRVSGCGMDMMFHTVASLSYSMGYGSLNQDNHTYHEKYKEDREECKECGIKAGRLPKNTVLGLKYKQL